ncbi:MAG: hypothetical protein ABSH34_31160 [Verrucomicrobiota bacterium]
MLPGGPPGNHLFIAQRVGNEGGNLKGTNTWPAKGLSWYGVSRRLRADLTRGAAFSGGKGGQGDTLKECFLVVIEAPETAGGGLAGLCADDHRLYLSCPGANEVRVYDTETMAPVAHWPAGHPGSAVLDPSGTLWLLHPRSGSVPAWISRHTAEGRTLPQRTEFAADAQPPGRGQGRRGCVRYRSRPTVSPPPALGSSFGRPGPGRGRTPPF